MQRIPFTGSAYTLRSVVPDNQACINLYIEPDPKSKRVPPPGFLLGTPGFQQIVSVGSAAIRAFYPVPGTTMAIVIAGSAVYTCTSAFVLNQIGSLATSSGNVSLADCKTQVAIVDGKGGWYIPVPAFTLNAVTDANFQLAATFVTFQNGFFFTSGDGSALIRSSNTFDFSTWPVSSYAGVFTESLILLRAVAIHDQLAMFTPQDVEIWTNAGNPAFPYQKEQGLVIEHGCAVAATVAKVDNTLFWLGQDNTGIGPVWRSNGYTPEAISNPMIDREIQSYAATSTITDAFALTYQADMHLFYILTFPTAGKTWVYDVMTKEWHQRGWFDTKLDNLRQWAPTCMAPFNGQIVAGDMFGNLGYVSLTTYTDSGPAGASNPIFRLRRTPTLEEDQVNMIYSRIVFDMQQAVGMENGNVNVRNPNLRLRWSDDSGRTWSSYRFVPLGTIGTSYVSRPQATQLGMGRNRVWEISCTDPFQFALVGALAAVTPGYTEGGMR